MVIMNAIVQKSLVIEPNLAPMNATREPVQIATDQISAESGTFHPLELIPYFRQFKRSALRTFLYTVLFNTIIAVFMTLMAIVFGDLKTWNKFFATAQNNFMISQAIGFTFAGVMRLASTFFARMNSMGTWTTIAGYTVVAFGVVQIAILGLSFLQPSTWGMRGWIGNPQWLLISLSLSFLISLMLTFAWRSRFTYLKREAEIAREQARLKEAQSQADNANLRALQAQIEPHFLFNTLANVTGLIHPQPDKAKLMLEQFIAYLRATLAATRELTTTLGKDVEMMRNFLAILQIRMGDRLTVHIDIAADVANCHLPPMLLQPIVENAIKHGLEPSVEGGEVAITARLDGNNVVITVADTGMGFSKGAPIIAGSNTDISTGGVGMANVRSRLLSTYGASAEMRVEANTRRGTKIVLVIPQNT
jgi:sensor histidine kinase YesM